MSMKTPKAAPSVRKTPNFDFIFGRYSKSNFTIPYFQVSMSFEDASQYLKLVNEMPGAASMAWRIEELFQRDINWKRVERKIVPYLKSQTQPQFFNSLTIALLPISNGAIQPFPSSGAGEWSPPKLENEQDFAGKGILDFGPVRCGYWNDWQGPGADTSRLGQLSWNTAQVCGVAIDGQHRLAAIKEVAANSSEPTCSSVPVILIVLAPELGFGGEASRDAVVDILRRLFIDLNKHAQRVSRARQILLDDRDPASICVRALVGSELQDGTAELSSIPPRIPLGLVDWHSEQAKFDEGPYLTTILGIDWIVARVLGIKPFEDPIAFDEIEKLITRLEGALRIKLQAARERLDECRKYERPFGFVDEPVDELKIIGEAFAARWSKPLVHLLTKFIPYQGLIELRQAHEATRREFANWYALKAATEEGAGKRATAMLESYQAQLQNDPVRPLATTTMNEAVALSGELKRAGELAFYVVFQRALVLAYLAFTRVTAAMVEPSGPAQDMGDLDLDGGGDDDEGASAGAGDVEHLRSVQIVDALNKFLKHESDFLKLNYEFTSPGLRGGTQRFWLGSLAQAEGTVDFTQAASKRANDLLLMVGLLTLLRDCRPELAGAAFSKIGGIFKNATAGLELKIKQCFDRMCAEVGSIAVKILAGREEDISDEKLRRAEILSRVEWIWSKVALY